MPPPGLPSRLRLVLPALVPLTMLLHELALRLLLLATNFPLPPALLFASLCFLCLLGPRSQCLLGPLLQSFLFPPNLSLVAPSLSLLTLLTLSLLTLLTLPLLAPSVSFPLALLTIPLELLLTLPLHSCLTLSRSSWPSCLSLVPSATPFSILPFLRERLDGLLLLLLMVLHDGEIHC